MGIAKFFKQSFTLWDKGINIGGNIVDQDPVQIDTFMGVLDKITTQRQYVSDKDTFDFTDVLFTPINSLLVENTIVKYGVKEYEVVSVIDPLYRQHHLEVLLNRR